MEWECPDCDRDTTTDESEMFLHRIREHTDADTADGSFNVTHDEIWEIYVEMARNEAVRRAPGDEPDVKQVAMEMNDMGVPTVPSEQADD